MGCVKKEGANSSPTMGVGGAESPTCARVVNLSLTYDVLRARGLHIRLLIERLGVFSFYHDYEIENFGL